MFTLVPSNSVCAKPRIAAWADFCGINSLTMGSFSSCQCEVAGVEPEQAASLCYASSHGPESYEIKENRNCASPYWTWIGGRNHCWCTGWHVGRETDLLVFSRWEIFMCLTLFLSVWVCWAPVLGSCAVLDSLFVSMTWRIHHKA